MFATGIDGISEDQRSAFRVQGFLSLSELCDAREAARLRAVFVDLHASPIGMTTGDRSDIVGDTNRIATVPQITHLERYTGALLDSPIRAKTYAIARDLLGDGAVLDCETMIVKLAGSPDATPWHQDECFWPPDTTRDAISFWIPLQDVGIDGGCMEFLPGSHRGEVLPHQPLRGVEDANAFELVDVDDRFRVVCPLPAGGGTLHHSRTAHSTGPNRTATARYAYVLVFSGPARKLDVPRDFRWQGRRGRDKRRAAARSGLNGLLNVAIRKASVLVARVNAWNDQRNWRSRR